MRVLFGAILFSCIFSVFFLFLKILKRNRLSCYAENIEARSSRYYFAVEKFEDCGNFFRLIGNWNLPVPEMQVYNFHPDHPDCEILKNCSGRLISFKVGKDLKLDENYVSDLLRITVK